ncbi:NAD(P)H-hydrate dehydratase [Lactobacillus sp. PV034]|uniref:NAD(P)H-hydrate dehydratase n=1 Tax=Lactobacillus sp. PV034 TaxID=2594495 RepID=UPI00223F68FE|nr:NAD(P)H-hydrate dehydratase [Lactobacillus sp. PV034]QNQ80093.1 NAD(P)H-hydrate dehydratase [Lactobacillus sp. PV034]
MKIKADILEQVIKPRKSASHKGNYGKILLIGGSSHYGGAIIMAAEGALNSGAGLLCVATHNLNVTALHSRDPEVMFIDWRDEAGLKQLLPQMDIVVCGMGLGTETRSIKCMELLRDNINNEQTLVLDASALTLISKNKHLLPYNAKAIILTPHQMEWQRLSEIRINYQNDAANFEALDTLFPQKNAYLVLKSNHTKIYEQKNHQVLENPLGNPGMATGGMGDTLAGIIGSFCGQFTTKLDTIAAAVYLHSLAGDKIFQENYIVRPTKLSASLPELMKKYGENNDEND